MTFGFSDDDCPHAYYVKEHRSYGNNIPCGAQGAIFPGDEAHWECSIGGETCCGDPNDAENCFKWSESDKFEKIDDGHIFWAEDEDEYNFDGTTYDSSEIIPEIFIPDMEERLSKCKDLLKPDDIKHLKLFLEKLQLEKI